LSELLVRWLGRVPYTKALEQQDALVRRRRSAACGDTLLLLEHPPVVTMGRSGDPQHLLVDHDELERRGIELHEAGRGGDVTYHGPGQLVGYPVVALRAKQRDAHLYLRNLEEALIRSAAGYGLAAGRKEGLTGVWVGEEKLAAIGVRLNSGWVTSHGFALNVTTDLSQFETIVPCGIGDRGVTSLERLLDSPPEMQEVAARVALELAAVLELQPVAAADPAERLSWTEGPDLFEGDPR